METIKHGSKDCNWFIPKDFLKPGSIVYCFGAGEDIQFEVDLANIYGCYVNIFDPTPRAYEHYLKRHNYYKIIDDNSLYFSVKGLSDEDANVKFYMPENPIYVSCSLEKENDNYIMARVLKLKTLMEAHEDTHIDLLKMDIEGTEYKVLYQIIEQDIPIRCIAVEFHNGIINLPGYETIKIDGNNVTFLKI